MNLYMKQEQWLLASMVSLLSREIKESSSGNLRDIIVIGINIKTTESTLPKATIEGYCDVISPLISSFSNHRLKEISAIREAIFAKDVNNKLTSNLIETPGIIAKARKNLARIPEKRSHLNTAPFFLNVILRKMP